MSNLYRESEQIALRPLRIADILGVYLNIRGNEVNKWTSEPDSKVVNNKVLKYFRKILYYSKKAFIMGVKALLRIRDDKVFRFAIKVKNTSTLTAGIVSITKCDDRKIADIGFWMGKKHWGKGYMSQVVRLAVDISFSELKLELLKAWTYGENMGSRKVLEKNGFTISSIEKDKYKLYGRSHDRYNYELAKVRTK